MTRRVHRKGRAVVVLEPNEKLVYAVKFAICIIVCLSGLEVAHMAFMHSWNSEVFAGISGLIGTVTGIILGQKA
ncbi:hypothetical protein MUP79_06680 [Candidatus Bathyarchaeota archaeon]|nr:hypothetical protein [Candidatus Bathyarchaeota archaeon]